jgi:uncharacterized membrane protein (DUF373 family)
MAQANRLANFGRNWGALGLYEKFEQIVALLLTLLIAGVVVATSIELAIDIFVIFTSGADLLDERLFQEIFGRIMTVLIALEFNHSIVQVVERQHHLIQVRVVVLVAILAIARKFIVIDIDKYHAGTLVALAVMIISLAVIYWVLATLERRERTERTQADGPVKTA